MGACNNAWNSLLCDCVTFKEEHFILDLRVFLLCGGRGQGRASSFQPLKPFPLGISLFFQDILKESFSSFDIRLGSRQAGGFVPGPAGVAARRPKFRWKDVEENPTEWPGREMIPFLIGGFYLSCIRPARSSDMIKTGRLMEARL